MDYRRSTYALYCLHDDSMPEENASQQQLYALSALTGQPEPLSLQALRCLYGIPAQRWLNEEDLAAQLPQDSPELLASLTQSGLVLVRGSGDPWLQELLRRHEQLDSDAWNGLSATYHFLGRWRDAHGGNESSHNDSNNDDPMRQDGGQLNQAEAEEFLTRHGTPPACFHQIERAQVGESLPTPRLQGGLWEALSRRKTTRNYDPKRPITREQLATMLYYVFGCHGLAPMFEGIHGIKKTSPSGGGLHPIEIYPLVLHAEGLQPGLYHYNLARHSLDLLEPLETEAARALASELTAGQHYASSAGVLFLMTARFFRNFWKYRRHEKAYGVLLMDAAHLSQTLYLVCAELGLGAFFTAAVNNSNIEERLGLDPYQEGALAICGCGYAASSGQSLEPRFRPFSPGPSASPGSSYS